MSTDSFSTHSLSNFNSKKLCATETIQAMKRLNENNLGTDQITPVWATSTTLLLPLSRKQGVIRNNSGNSRERTTKVSQLIRYFIQLCQHKINITHTLLIAQIQIQRECPLFIGGFSNRAFFTSLMERQNKQSDAQWHAQQWHQDW